MKNKIKLMIMAAISVIMLTGCGAKSPSDVVETYFSGLKNGENMEVANQLLDSMSEGESDEESNKDTKEDPKMEEAMKIFTSKIDVKVLSEDIKDDKAVVELELSGINFSNVIMEILQESIANAFGGQEINEDEMSNTYLEKIKAGKIETRTGKINLSKVDNEWKIETDDNLIALVFGKANISNELK